MTRRPRPESFEDFNEKTIDHIVAQVRYPAADKAGLRKDLLACYERTFRLFPQRPRNSIKRQQDRWKSIRKHADRLVKLIEADKADLDTVRGILGNVLFGGSNAADPAVTQETIISWSDVIVGELRNLAAELERREREPIEFIRNNRERYGIDLGEVVMQKLTGEWLPEIFEKHFKRKAGSSRLVKGGQSGRPTGPYIRFVKAVLAAWKLDYSEEAITAAVQRGKKKI
jgi:hypothetical protein